MKAKRCYFAFKIIIMPGAKEFDPASLVTDIVKEDYRTADVFRKYGIEYCCGGNWPLEVACKAHGVDLDLLREELKQSSRDVCIPGSVDYKEWDIDFLANYIIHLHHAYLKKALPDIKKMLRGFLEGHEKKYPYAIEIEKYFLQLSNGLLPHLQHEEEIIFPYVRQIAHAYKNGESYARLLVRTLRKPIQQIMATEHKRIAAIMQKIQELSDDYTSPPGACISHKVLIVKLKELHGDLEQHIYLEKDILFPKAVSMEKELLDHTI